jgi:hypothetical protein
MHHLRDRFEWKLHAECADAVVLLVNAATLGLQFLARRLVRPGTITHDYARLARYLRAVAERRVKLGVVRFGCRVFGKGGRRGDQGDNEQEERRESKEVHRAHRHRKHNAVGISAA